ncbi:hypothetical protein V5799_000613 [Amblyomma americanum]|uniref:Calcium-activated chloride channel N-terminal domain-containing protein n=1 Tax=Amblyomma americanum TaxID=6943 RepID=A0AAQ4D2J9_AMBAM
MSADCANDENVQALFRSSTEFLHKATNGRVYFKHVIIEVPKTWPKRNSSRAPSSSASEKSDVLIDMPTPPYEDRPFTTQVKPCGEPGEFIHLTPRFVATLTNSTAKRFINPVKVSVRVESEPRAKDYEPILVTCKMPYLIVDKSDRAVVFAKVTKGTKSVLDAVVLARVYRPEKDPLPIKFPLHDDGEYPDHQKNDGWYGGFFVDFIGKGRYTVMVEVSNQKSTRLAYALSGWDSFLTTSFLHATTVSAAVIRAAASYQDLQNDFENQAEITEANVVEGNLDPKPSGAQHNVTLSMPLTFCLCEPDNPLYWHFWLAVQVSNSDGLTSTSNLVPADCGPPPVDCGPPLDTTTVAATTKATATRAPTSMVTTTQAVVTTQPVVTTQAEDAAKESIRESDFVASPLFWVGLSCIAAAIVIVIAVAVSVILKREEEEES